MAKLLHEAGEPVLYLHANEYHRVRLHYPDVGDGPLRVRETDDHLFRIEPGGHHHVETQPDFSVRLRLDPEDIASDFTVVEGALSRSQGSLHIKPVTRDRAITRWSVPEEKPTAVRPIRRSRVRERAFATTADVAETRPAQVDSLPMALARNQHLRTQAEEMLQRLKVNRRGAGPEKLAEIDRTIARCRRVIAGANRRDEILRTRGLKERGEHAFDAAMRGTLAGLDSYDATVNPH